MIDALSQWIDRHETLVWVTVTVSIVIFFASLLAMPAIAIRIPPDYFTHERRPLAKWRDQRRAIRITLRVLKNVAGALLLLAGVAMLVLPGQGLLTILIGFLLLEFPGKYALERSLIRRRWVHRPINWLRRRHARPPLITDERTRSDDE